MSRLGTMSLLLTTRRSSRPVAGQTIPDRRCTEHGEAANATLTRTGVSLSFFDFFFGRAPSCSPIEDRVCLRPATAWCHGGHTAYASLGLPLDAPDMFYRRPWCGQGDVLRNTVPSVQDELVKANASAPFGEPTPIRLISVISAQMCWSDKARRRPETWSFLTGQPPRALVAVLA